MTGDVTVLVNMTLYGMTANMTLLTTSAPVLFTMPGKREREQGERGRETEREGERRRGERGKNK